jgi:hypothetical protein
MCGFQVESRLVLYDRMINAYNEAKSLIRRALQATTGMQQQRVNMAGGGQAVTDVNKFNSNERYPGACNRPSLPRVAFLCMEDVSIGTVPAVSLGILSFHDCSTRVQYLWRMTFHDYSTLVQYMWRMPLQYLENDIATLQFMSAVLVENDSSWVQYLWRMTLRNYSVLCAVLVGVVGVVRVLMHVWWPGPEAGSQLDELQQLDLVVTGTVVEATIQRGLLMAGSAAARHAAAMKLVSQSRKVRNPQAPVLHLPCNAHMWPCKTWFIG